MSPIKVLICGGGIAGNALAFMLASSTFDVTIIERHPELRASGLQIDLRGHAIEVLRRLNLEQAFRKHAVHEQGVRVVNGCGHTQAYFPANRSGKGAQSFTSDFEIMRGDFVHLLYDAASEKTNFHARFGVTIQSIEQVNAHVFVTFSDGETESFDLIIGADGQNSRTRRTMLDSLDPSLPDPIHHLRSATAYFTTSSAVLPDVPPDCTVSIAPNHRLIMTRHNHPSQIQTYMSCPAPLLADTRRNAVEDEKHVLATYYRQTPDQRFTPFMNAMHASADFHCERPGVVKLSTWSHQRIVLVGDAAYCPTFNTGMGTSSALIGAYILAGELHRHCHDHVSDTERGAAADEEKFRQMTAAFQGYEARFRPFMEIVQKDLVEDDLRGGGFLNWIPTSEMGIGILYWVLYGVSLLRLHWIVSFLFKERVGDWKLPDYRFDV